MRLKIEFRTGIGRLTGDVAKIINPIRTGLVAVGENGRAVPVKKSILVGRITLVASDDLVVDVDAGRVIRKEALSVLAVVIQRHAQAVHSVL